MKKVSLGMIFAVVFGMVFGFISFIPPQTQADVSSWQKGASIYPATATDFASTNFQQTLANLKADGANYVTLIIPYYQTGFSTTDVHGGINTPTDQALAQGIDTAHSLGLKVMLKVHDDVAGSSGWRANINPSDRTTWFTNYGNVLNHLGDIAKAHGAEEICMGTEMIDMSTYRINSTNTQNWIKMIQNLRTHFSGLLIYDANWGDGDAYNETKFIGFWPNLDFIGISGYYDLNPDSSASVASLVKSWGPWDTNNVLPLYNQFHKPILFTEIGYRSVTGASGQPWNYALTGPVNQTEQANAYTALFQYWSQKSYFAGVQLWRWEVDPSAGGANDSGYTPQHKLAENVLKQWWGGAVTPPTGTSTPPITGTSTPPVVPPVTGTTTPPVTGTTTPPVNNPPPVAGQWSSQATGQVAPASQASTFNISVTSSQPAGDIIIDTEIYDASNNKLLQQFFEHQNFSANQGNPYKITWTPQNAGSYVIKLGTFSSDWSKNYYWNNSVMNFMVNTATQPPVVPPITGTTPPPVTGTTTPPVVPPVTGTTTPPVIPPVTSTTTPPIATTTPPVNPPVISPTNFDTNIWWPSNGASVSGVQPFKAMVINKSTSDYNMFWQVDGGGLNQMYDSSQDYPHKEALVDLSSWHWQPSGNYQINFVSKDLSGTTISQKGITINVH